MADHIPAQLANLGEDQAPANTDLDCLVADQRRMISRRGTLLAADLLASQIQASGITIDRLASIAALAITRLAEER